MEGSEQPTPEQGVSKRYLIFLVVIMGLVSNMDSWLSLIESKAVKLIVDEFFPLLTEQEGFAQFLLLQGTFGVIVFGVFFIAWFADAFGRRKGIMLLVLVMGVPSILIVFLSYDIYWFLLLYSVVIMGTTSNLWEVPITEEAPAKSRGMYGSAAFLIGVIPIYAIVGTRIITATNWRWGYGVMFFLMIVLMILLFFMKEPQRWKDAEQARENKRIGIREAVGKLGPQDRKYLVIATLVYLTWTISFKLATTSGAQYFIDVLQTHDQTGFDSILTVAGLLLPVSALISGILLDKVGRNVVLVIGSLGSMITYVALGITHNPIFYQSMYFFMAMVLAWIYVYLAEIFPTEIRATSIGVCVTGARLGYVVGPFLGFVLVSLFADMGGFWIVGGLLMLIPLLTLLAKPLETKGKTLEEIAAVR